MPDTATTKRVLARLARRPVDRLVDSQSFDGDYRAVVDTATSATARLETTASFVESGGLARL
ncbi:MAG: hypothetical protein ABEI77_00410, partial [Halorientalis sp.]